MVCFTGGILIILIVLVILLIAIRRYVYPSRAAKWRDSKGLGKAMANMYDWIDGRPKNLPREEDDYEVAEVYYQ